MEVLAIGVHEAHEGEGARSAVGQPRQSVELGIGRGVQQLQPPQRVEARRVANRRFDRVHPRRGAPLRQARIPRTQGGVGLLLTPLSMKAGITRPRPCGSLE
jgi:hypothetical protein